MSQGGRGETAATCFVLTAWAPSCKPSRHASGGSARPLRKSHRFVDQKLAEPRRGRRLSGCEERGDAADLTS